jgi:hypothetical protein
MSQKYLNYDSTGNILGFYSDDVHSVIPTPNTKITNEQWQDCLSNPGRRKIENGKIVECEIVQTDAEKLSIYKSQRDALLAATDNMYACDDFTIANMLITMDQRAELKTYRQALRDAPEKSYPNFPSRPSWLP